MNNTIIPNGNSVEARSIASIISPILGLVGSSVTNRLITSGYNNTILGKFIMALTPTGFLDTLTDLIQINENKTIRQIFGAVNYEPNKIAKKYNEPTIDEICKSSNYWKVDSEGTAVISLSYIKDINKDKELINKNPYRNKENNKLKVPINNTKINPYMLKALIIKDEENNYKPNIKLTTSENANSTFWNKIEKILPNIYNVNNYAPDIYHMRKRNECSVSNYILDNIDVEDSENRKQYKLNIGGKDEKNGKQYKLKQHSKSLIIGNNNIELEITDEMYNILRNCSGLNDKISSAKGIGYYNELYIGIFLFILFISASIIIVVMFTNSLSVLCPTLVLLAGQLLALFSLKATVVRIEFNFPNNNEDNIPLFLNNIEEVNLLIEWHDINGTTIYENEINLAGNSYRWLTTQAYYRYSLFNQWIAFFSMLLIIIGYIGVLILLQYSDALLWIIIITFILIVRHIILIIIPGPFLCVDNTRAANCKLIIEKCIPGVTLKINTSHL